MASFVVMEPAGKITGDARLVKDGFSLLGFLVPPLWLLWHGLLAEAAVVFALMFGIAAGSEALGFGLVGSLLSLLVSLYVGLEGAAMQIAHLIRRGWREIGIVDAETLDDAEIRYADAVARSHVDERVDIAAAVSEMVTHRPSTARTTSGPALGLLSYPGS